jgi:hypothetical protein
MKTAPVVNLRAESALAIIETLEELLADAKAGKLKQLAAAYVDTEGNTSSQWASAPHQHQAVLLGAIDMMHDKIREHLRCFCARHPA